MKIFRILLVLLIFPTLINGQDQPGKFNNPVIPGFHPDPSICRVADDYYLVNSSFEWFPGIPVFHSKDLVNWKLIGYGITQPRQVELPSGLKDSRGIYAVTIRYHNGIFYLITTCVNCKGNFYITATNPAGPWSDPVWLGSHGIDPSLFWDDNGKCYYTGHGFIGKERQWPNEEGAWIQELDLDQKKLVGERVQLTNGHASNAQYTEGPHLYKIDGKYMLLVAEGGTGFHHAVTVFHSDKVFGPYIPDHANPVLTHRNLGKEYPIHSVGHADLVQTQDGDWWAVMLAKRMFGSKVYLGRETFLTPVKFENGTPVFNPGIGKVLQSEKRPNLPWTPTNPLNDRDEFDGAELGLNWNFLRTPYIKWYDLKMGSLKINLRPEVVDSMVNPSMIARRIEHFSFSAKISMTFSTKKANEEAGLIIYRASTNHYQLMKTDGSVVLYKTLKGKRTEIERHPYKNSKVIFVVISVNGDLAFSYGESENNMVQIGQSQTFDVISDEFTGGFTGPFTGMYATGNGKESKASAIFEWFEYKEIK